MKETSFNLGDTAINGNTKLVFAAGVLAGAAILVAGYFALPFLPAGKALASKITPAQQDQFHVITPNQSSSSPAPSTPAPNLNTPLTLPDPFNNPGTKPGDPNWDPFQDMQQMQQQMDALFKQAFGGTNSMGPMGKMFPNGFGADAQTDLQETPDKYIVKLDLPGIDESSVDVTVENGTLKVTSKREQNSSSTGPNNGLGQARHVGQFTRIITLAQPVDPASLTTDYKNGVLTVEIKKAQGNPKTPLAVP